jgi:hypothetical protein
MRNMTPHAIVIETQTGAVIIPPTGSVVRIEMEESEEGFVVVGDLKVPFITRTPGRVIGLPTDGEECVVSTMVLDALRANPPEGLALETVFAPDTGKTAIRDDGGRIVAVTRLVGAV